MNRPGFPAWGSMITLCLGCLGLMRPTPYSFLWPHFLIIIGITIAAPLAATLVQQVTGDPALQRMPMLLMVGAGFVVPSFLPGMGSWMPLVTAVIWLGVTMVFAVATLISFRGRALSLPHALIALGPVQLVVGAAWLVLDRGHWDPFGFGEVIVRLTAAHFHFAGLVLPVCVGHGLLCDERPPVWARAAGWTVLSGVPLVAVGITLTRMGAPLWMECTLAILFGTGAWLAGLHQTLFGIRKRRWLLAVSGIGLTAGMTFALLYGLRAWLPLPWLHIPRMWALHGTIQVFVYALPSLIGWLRYSAAHRETLTGMDVP